MRGHHRHRIHCQLGPRRVLSLAVHLDSKASADAIVGPGASPLRQRSGERRRAAQRQRRRADCPRAGGSSIMRSAPAPPSSAAGWNMTSRSPGGCAAARAGLGQRRAAWPCAHRAQAACITPGCSEAYGAWLCSSIGRASMSARRSTVLPGEAPRSRPTRRCLQRSCGRGFWVPAQPLGTTRPSVAPQTPAPGCWWISRRSATSESLIPSAASSRLGS